MSPFVRVVGFIFSLALIGMAIFLGWVAYNTPLDKYGNPSACGFACFFLFVIGIVSALVHLHYKE